MPSSDDVINNIKKISEKYQEILLFLIQGKKAFVPDFFNNSQKIQEAFTKGFQRITHDPDKILQANLDYANKFKELIDSSINKFLGKEHDINFNSTKGDKRFKDPAWQENIYFNFIKEYYFITSDWMSNTVKQINLEPKLNEYIEFQVKQIINALSPTNFILCNPIVFKETIESGWQNIVQGMDNFLSDIKKTGEVMTILTTDSKAFAIGQNIAVTEGKIVYQNDLMQLICYKSHDKSHAVPIIIVPPWINKYYILDLSPHNSLVKYLVDNNFQVFLVSWINPDAKLADKDFEDYLEQGILEPCKFIESLGYSVVNAMGYCIGGTLLATALAYARKNHSININSASFLTTLLDFSKPGEIGIFIDESTISVLEEEIKSTGYFDGRYLSNSFSLLRANDLIWSFFINNYLLGRSPLAFDLLYWNADSTNLPAQMYSFYLRNMYLKNLLIVPDGLKILGTDIDLSLVNQPTFFLATSDDHIAPWQSVFEGMQFLSNSQKTFCLAGSGHVAGVINPPNLNKYNYKINSRVNLDMNQWLSTAVEHQGSWWTNWQQWLIKESGGLINSISYENLKFIEPAPGNYVKSSINQ